jgi:hypothetical protein
MARIILTVVCAWGVFIAVISLWGMASDVLTAQHVHLSGWTLQLTDEYRSGGSYSRQDDSVALLLVAYFAVAGLLFLTVAVWGRRWLRSPDRALWFSGCAMLTAWLCLFGMISGFVLFGVPFIVFVFLAMTRERHELRTTEVDASPPAAS